MRGDRKHESWREKGGVWPVSPARITSFFVSNFPEECTKVDLWKVFQKWGRIWDVYIARKRDRYGGRFGFVEFLDVRNQDAMAYKLDNIVIGNTKLKVNLPRFRKHNRFDTLSQGNNEYPKNSNMVHIGVNRLQARRSEFSNKVPKKHSWNNQNFIVGQIVDRGFQRQPIRGFQRHQGNIWRAKNAKNDEEPWKGMDVTLEAKAQQWMLDSWVGYLHDLRNVDKLRDSSFVDGDVVTHMRYMGDNMIMLTATNPRALDDTIQNANEEWMNMFESFQKWNEDMAPGNRAVWVRIFGIPIHLWTEECIKQVVVQLGSLIELDNETTNYNNIEYARASIKTSGADPIMIYKHIRINGKIYHIRVVEELGTQRFQCDGHIAEEPKYSSDASSLASDIGLDVTSTCSEEGSEVDAPVPKAADRSADGALDTAEADRDRAVDAIWDSEASCTAHVAETVEKTIGERGVDMEGAVTSGCAGVAVTTVTIDVADGESHVEGLVNGPGEVPRLGGEEQPSSENKTVTLERGLWHVDGTRCTTTNCICGSGLWHNNKNKNKIQEEDLCPGQHQLMNEHNDMQIYFMDGLKIGLNQCKKKKSVNQVSIFKDSTFHLGENSRQNIGSSTVGSRRRRLKKSALSTMISSADVRTVSGPKIKVMKNKKREVALLKKKSYRMGVVFKGEDNSVDHHFTHMEERDAKEKLGGKKETKIVEGGGNCDQ